MKGSPKLLVLSQSLIEIIRGTATIDWVRKETPVRMQNEVRKLLARYRDPPDPQPTEFNLFIREAEALAMG